MEIIISRYSGYCFGVKRALKLTHNVLDNSTNKNKKIFSFGSIINNPGVTEKLSKKGLVQIKDIDEIEDNSIFIVRSHGMSPDLINKIRVEKKSEIIDATCPFVKKAQARAEFLSENGYFVIVIGNKNHPEVLGIKGYIAGNNYMVVENEKDVDKIPDNKKIGVVVQTTQTREKLLLITGRLLEKTREILIYNTICDTTWRRQDSTKKLAADADVMIIVGGKDSANTVHLKEISKEINNSTYHIESFKELRPEWFKNKKRAGISGGASTPMEDIIEVKRTIEKIDKQQLEMSKE